MKLFTLLLLLFPWLGNSQSIAGKWITIDENSGVEKSVIEIFEKNGKYYGKVVKIFPTPGEDPDPVCNKCPADDERFNKKIIGMEILKGLEKSGDSYTDGHILDPEIGKIYKCKIWLEESNLMVRGYWGPFFRTQTWKKTL